jgi:hypothetical protein
VDSDYLFCDFLKRFAYQFCRRDLVKIALTVPSGNPVLFAIFRAPIPACWFRERTVRTVSSGRGGLPSLLPLPRATLVRPECVGGMDNFFKEAAPADRAIPNLSHKGKLRLEYE